MKIFLLLLSAILVDCIEKIVSRRGICIGTVGKKCTESDLRVCIKINGKHNIFEN
jgi:NOL1/NOP2/fmu family ribosome biogenesis protein